MAIDNMHKNWCEVTTCDPIWHVSSCIAVWQVRLRTAVSVFFTFTLRRDDVVT